MILLTYLRVKGILMMMMYDPPDVLKGWLYIDTARVPKEVSYRRQNHLDSVVLVKGR